MNFIKFKVNEKQNCCIISFELLRDLQPHDLKEITPPDAVKDGFASKGVILSGRGPIWLYGFLIHFYHPTKFIAIYDPRLNAAIVVESHTLEYKVGDIIENI